MTSQQPPEGLSAEVDRDLGRPVPPHGSGGSDLPSGSNSDETTGRALYPRRADAEAQASAVPNRRATLAGSTALTTAEDGLCPKCGGTHPGRYPGACAGPPTPSAPPPHKMQG